MMNAVSAWASATANLTEVYQNALVHAKDPSRCAFCLREAAKDKAADPSSCNP
jgi:hypothetical protein